MAEVEYEARDVNPRAVLKAATVLAGFTLLGAGASLAMFVWLDRRAQRHDVVRPSLLQHEPDRLPPEPRLQRAPQADLAQVRRQERERLTTYGWVDRQAGIVRIPIDRAMELYAQRTTGRSLAPVVAPAMPALPSEAAAPGGPPPSERMTAVPAPPPSPASGRRR